MLTVSEARTRILEKNPVISGSESLPLLSAVGRVLASDVTAAVNVPSCDNSAMDGYAVRVVDCQQEKMVPVVGEIYAGALPGILLSGTAQRIFTGAPVPAGADAVVMQEDVLRDGDSITLKAGASVKAGDNIRRCGEDIADGATLFVRSHRLRAVDVGLLASVGVAKVSVVPLLRVGLLCTGDELLEPGDMPQPGKIYNSNRYLLAALLRDLGCDVIDAGKVRDDLAVTEKTLRDLSGRCDVIISTGGVSVGDADFVKQAVQSSGRLDVWKIAVKPGKPLAFGDVQGKPFFGLPGNPVSAFVTFQLFVRPFLQQAQGSVPQDLRRVPAMAGFAWPTAGQREEYLRVHLRQENGALVARVLPNQGSGVLSSVVHADALLRVLAGATFAQGDSVECLLL